MFRNTLKTVVLLAGLAGFFVVVGTVLGGPTGTLIGLALGLVLVGGSFCRVDRLMALQPSIASRLVEVRA